MKRKRNIGEREKEMEIKTVMGKKWRWKREEGNEDKEFNGKEMKERERMRWKKCNVKEMKEKERSRLKKKKDVMRENMIKSIDVMGK